MVGLVPRRLAPTLLPHYPIGDWFDNASKRRITSIRRFMANRSDRWSAA